MKYVFDSLKFHDYLKAADVPEKQARVQAEAMRNAFAAYDAGKMKDLATKADLAVARNELKETGLRILKWVIGTIITQTAFVFVMGIAMASSLK